MKNKKPKRAGSKADVVSRARANGAIVKAIDPYGHSPELMMAAFMATFHPGRRVPKVKGGAA